MPHMFAPVIEKLCFKDRVGMNSKLTLGLLALVTLVAFVLAYTLPTTELMKGIVATPGILGMLWILYQLIRDEAAFERNKKIQNMQQTFGLGASSHMANKVFDKHVEFCEKYLAEVHRVANQLFREGPTEEAVSLGNGFYTLKLEYAAWINDEISDLLFPFEQALRELGAKKGFINSTMNIEAYAEARQKKIPQVHEEYSKILNLGNSDTPDPLVAIESVIIKARSILDLDELIWLRKEIIKQAKAKFET